MKTEQYDLPGEEWKWVKGWENLYALSTFGRYKSFARKKQIEICQALVDLHPRRNEPQLREAWFSYYQYLDEKNQKKT